MCIRTYAKTLRSLSKAQCVAGFHTTTRPSLEELDDMTEDLHNGIFAF